MVEQKLGVDAGVIPGGVETKTLNENIEERSVTLGICEDRTKLEQKEPENDSILNREMVMERDSGVS